MKIHKTIYKGSAYKEGMFVVVAESAEGYWFVKLALMLHHKAHL